jgi:DNA-binding PadR family transcriptional regulator
MSFRLKEEDCKSLVCLADHRMLTVTQLAALSQKSMQVVRRRLCDLEKAGLVEVVRHEHGRGRGRPENSLGLTKQGVDILRDKGLIDRTVPYDRVVADALFGADHQMQLNWFRIHVAQIGKALPRLSVKFLACNSPYLPPGPDGPVSITDCSPVPGRGIQEVKFTPDAVFATFDSGGEKMCLLFFLEVDRGTETMASPRRDMTDIRQKIVNYQWYFRSLKYKRYESVFHCSLRGFRLLFLTNSLGRLTALCHLAQEMPPSDFVWLTECSRLFPDGVSAKIWARGGDLQGPPQSILGRLCCRAPLP